MDMCEHRIKLTKKDSLDGQHLFLELAGVEGNKVKLSQKVSSVTKLFSLQNGELSLAPKVSIACLAGLADERSKRNT